MTEPKKENIPPRIIVAKPITAQALMGDAFRARDTDQFTLDLSNDQIFLAASIDQDGRGRILYTGAIPFPLTGNQFNRLLYTIAPSKSSLFGLDTFDITSDWNTITQTGSYATNLRRGHERMGTAWKRFMQEREFLRTHVAQGDTYNPKQASIVPVLQWEADEKGHRKWIYQYPAGKVWETLKEETDPLVANNAGENVYHPMTGLFTVALYSPDVTDLWPERMGYVEGAHKTQLIGPTQVPVLALLQEEQLLAGQFIRHAEAYVKTAAGI